MDFYNSCPYIELEQLSSFAESTARLLSPCGECSAGKLKKLLNRAYSSVCKTVKTVNGRFSSISEMPPACEWISENSYVAARERISALSELADADALRCTFDGGVLIYELCLTLLRSGQGRLSEERITNYLRGFQGEAPLTGAELRLFPAALRIAAIKLISDVGEAMLRSSSTDAHAEAFESLFSSLRLIAETDFDRVLSDASVVNRLFSKDPTGEYSHMDSQTKLAYILRLEELARKERMSEAELADRLILNAAKDGRHIGFYLFSEKANNGAVYIAFNILLSVFFSVLLGFVTESYAAPFLLILPVSELVKRFLDAVLLRTTDARRIMRMDVSEGIPDDGRTVCVISVLLADKASAEPYAKRLEHLCASESGKSGNLLFGILADLPAADTQNTQADTALIESAEREIARLNSLYGGGFFLFTRERTFNGERYEGAERKRGALLELAKYLCGDQSTVSIYGDEEILNGTRYIVTLDSDTEVYPGDIKNLIGAMLHPLNRAVIDTQKRVVTSGYGLIHPRIDTELSSSRATDFALIYAGSGGSDPYCSLCGEVYMNAFDSGGFAGKGIIDAQALLVCTGDYPAGQILSHDALEGAALHGGYMGDAQFSDSFPAEPISYYKRLHRWIRGDWQNAPWLFGRGRAFRPIDRWKLFDSLRRSLLRPAVLTAIIAGLFSNGSAFYIAAAAAVLSLMSELLSTLSEHIKRSRIKRYSRLLTGLGGSIVRFFMELWLLPYTAWVSASAALTALWRMLISHKELLQWQTAAQSSAKGAKLIIYFKKLWFPVIVGMSLLVLSPTVIGRTAGLMWIVSPAAAFALALPAYASPTLSPSDARWLKNRAKENWRYFEELITAENNFLPPDNFQTQPPLGAVKRTSPTNIGFAMASAVAAMDLDIISPRAAIVLISAITDTLEKLERHMGHFLNWYNIETLEPLTPKYISTVDSGNLCASLLVCAAAAKEKGCLKLEARLSRLAEEMDFSPLYDTRCSLFHICYDTANSRPAGGHYDLLASEAMLTSYLAVSRGDVPLKHWKMLSRAQLKKDGYRGLASWSGSMFEYLMPMMFLPIYRGSMLYESCRFCLYAQKKAVSAGMPWGMSESAFFSVNRELDYRYKAHGASALALKKGMDSDRVISPYSSFLALAVDPSASANNLRHIYSLGAIGKFGFIEALDFTPSRCRSERGEAVFSHMAHHIGMSIVSSANALCHGSIQNRFMSLPAMGAHALLLQEQLNDLAAILPSSEKRPAIEKPIDISSWSRHGSCEDTPAYCPLSNGIYDIMLTSSGNFSASVREMTAYRNMRISIDGCDILPSSSGRYSFEESEFTCITELNGTRCVIKAGCSADELGEYRIIRINDLQEACEQIILDLTPILAPISDYVNHSPFWRLGMYAAVEDNVLTVRRVKKNTQREMWLSISASLPMRLHTEGWLLAPSVSLSFPIKDFKNGQVELVLALSIGTDRQSAISAALRILDTGRSSRGAMLSSAAARLGMNSAEIAFSLNMLPSILEKRFYAPYRKEDLWQYGISGDHAIISCPLDAAEAEKVAARFCLLRACGVEADLCYITGESGEYNEPKRKKLSSVFAGFGLEALIGAPGGVHFVPEFARKLMYNASSVFIGRKADERTAAPIPELASVRGRCIPENVSENGCFRFAVNGELPPRTWQNILTNGRFSCIAAEYGIAYLWLDNAREKAITRPPADELSAQGSVSIWIDLNGVPLSLFAANDGLKCTVSYYAGAVKWEKDFGDFIVRTELFIPDSINAAVLVIRGLAGKRLSWSVTPNDPEDIKYVIKDNVYSVKHLSAGLTFAATASSEMSIRSDFAPPSMLAGLDCAELTVLAVGCCEASELKALCEEKTVLFKRPMMWKELLSRFSLTTSVHEFDSFMSYWCPYQTIACRIYARASLYQRGGAIGFRDQLQDAVNMLLIDSSFARERILDCCRHQYREGDVMHWWHSEKGLRSSCSDDLLWLPWALGEYVEATGDNAILDERVPYLASPVLGDGERDRYEAAGEGSSASVFEHAVAAVDRFISRGFGPHGLPKMLGGDWNDALCDAGGESVWLAWFFVYSLEKMSLCKPIESKYRELSVRVKAAADSCFNGAFYPRGFLENGSILGGAERIDSIVQSWAVFCATGCSDAALNYALCKLSDRDNRLIRLLWPPYTAEDSDLGYISSYGEGIRENGGQYTHAAIWLAKACFECGRADDGYEVLSMLLPENHDISKYLAEPFVLPADVCSLGDHAGEAGWTWYTGSAGWFFRVVTESMLGLRLSNGKLTVSPNLPRALPGYDALWCGRRISVRDGRITVDGRDYYGGELSPQRV